MECVTLIKKHYIENEDIIEEIDNITFLILFKKELQYELIKYEELVKELKKSIETCGNKIEGMLNDT